MADSPSRQAPQKVVDCFFGDELVTNESVADCQKVIDPTQRVDDCFFGFHDGLSEVADLARTVGVSSRGDGGPHPKSRLTSSKDTTTPAKQFTTLSKESGVFIVSYSGLLKGVDDLLTGWSVFIHGVARTHRRVHDSLSGVGQLSR